MIDEARIQEMKSLFGESEFGELVDLFREEADALVSGLPGRTGTDLVASLHAIRGSAENMGLRDLSALCRAGEAHAKDGMNVDIAPILSAFDDSLRMLRDYVGPG